MVVVGDASMLLRALKGPELACLMAILMSPGPAKARWIQTATGLSDRTVTEALDLLLSLGLAQHNGNRSNWVPTQGICAAFFHRAAESPGVGERPALSPPDHPDVLTPGNGITTTDDITEQAIHPEEGTLDDDPSNRVAMSYPMKGRAPADDHAVNCSDKSVVNYDAVIYEPAAPSLRSNEEDIMNLTTLNPSSDSSAELPQTSAPDGIPGPPELETSKAGLRRILAATRVLFGETVLGPPERYSDPSLLLGSIAEAYCQRKHLRNPARVVYSNMKNGVQPAEEYLRNPMAYLPDGFLRAAGLIAEGQKVHKLQGESTETDGWEDPDSELFGFVARETPCLPDPSVELKVAIQTDHPDHPPGGSEHSACQAWQILKSMLLTESPRSVYQQFIEPLRLAHFDPDACVFTLLAADPYSRQWLEERMRRILEHMLSGICNRPAHAIFIHELENA